MRESEREGEREERRENIMQSWSGILVLDINKPLCIGITKIGIVRGAIMDLKQNKIT